MSIKSPFPGMDPYLEQHWRDVHTSLITYSRDQLQEQLPTDLIARSEERILVQAEDQSPFGMYPDVRVVEQKAGRTATAASAQSETLLAEPLLINLKAEAATEAFIEIREARTDNRVVTVIEFLSMSAKTPGKDQRKYRKKQQELVRQGESGRNQLAPSWQVGTGRTSVLVPRRARTHYQACIRRGWKRAQVQLFPMPLGQLLPTIPIPLRQQDAEVRLDLQPLIAQAYRNGRYDAIDYKAEPVPPLQSDDAAWADELLKAAGKR